MNFNLLDIPWAPVNSAIDVIKDQHLKVRQIFNNYINTETGEEELQIRFPALFSTSLPSLQNSAPALGQHTEEILKRLNYQSQAIDHLQNIKAVGVR
ncbi:CoA transferase [Bacillus anthracis]|nr:CoA transferase [Bacillus anthracis]